MPQMPKPVEQPLIFKRLSGLAPAKQQKLLEDLENNWNPANPANDLAEIGSHHGVVQPNKKHLFKKSGPMTELEHLRKHWGLGNTWPRWWQQLRNPEAAIGQALIGALKLAGSSRAVHAYWVCLMPPNREIEAVYCDSHNHVDFAVFTPHPEDWLLDESQPAPRGKRPHDHRHRA